MSKWKGASDLILKCTVWPGCTLIVVAKPWIDESPAPLVCHCTGGVPGWEFSQAILLVTGGVHGSTAAWPAAGRHRNTPRASRHPARNVAKPGQAGRRLEMVVSPTAAGFIMRLLFRRDP